MQSQVVNYCIVYHKTLFRIVYGLNLISIALERIGIGLVEVEGLGFTVWDEGI